MAGSAARVPSLHLQPESVDFIDNLLPTHHEIFKKPEARYDSAVQRYVPHPAAAPPQGPQFPPPRKLLPEVQAMVFWNLIFLDSMKAFEAEIPKQPEDLPELTYSIRGKRSWDDVHSQLQKAREHYDGKKQGLWGRIKREFRKMGDNIEPIQQLVNAIPDNEYVSPVLAVVQVLLDAAKAASKIRAKLKLTFDDEGLEQKFGNIEVFLGTFPKDEPIKKASIKLLVSTLKAIEAAVIFFIKHEGARMASAVFQGEKYQESLLGSIDQIDTCTQELIQEASKSSTVSTVEGLNAILAGNFRLELIGNATETKVQFVMEKVELVYKQGTEILMEVKVEANRAAKSDAELLNLVQSMFDDGQELLKQTKEANRRAEEANKQAEEANKQAKEANEQAKEANKLNKELLEAKEREIQDLRLRVQQSELERISRAPSPSQLEWPPPPPQQPPSPYYVPPPAYQPPLQYPTPQQAPPPWPIYPPKVQQAPYIDTSAVLVLLNIANIDLIDLQNITERRQTMPLKYRSRAEKIVNTQQFRDWAVLPTSRELLVHGDLMFATTNKISALSLLCATLMQALRTRQNYISLVFFAGCHVDEDDGHSGGHAMMRSMIAQLLRQNSFDLTTLSTEVDLEHVSDGDLNPLFELFSWLVRCLPDHVTVVCLIDGLIYYETDEFEEGTLAVLGFLLGLVRDADLKPSMKLLGASPSPTDTVRELFSNEDECFLSMAELPWTGPQFGFEGSDSEGD